MSFLTFLTSFLDDRHTCSRTKIKTYVEQIVGNSGEFKIITCHHI